jgi:hypothetical protein
MTILNTPTKPPITDLSPKVVRLARLLDRLERGGTYIVRLEKPACEGERWKVTVETVRQVREMEA